MGKHSIRGRLSEDIDGKRLPNASASADAHDEEDRGLSRVLLTRKDSGRPKANATGRLISGTSSCSGKCIDFSHTFSSEANYTTVNKQLAKRRYEVAEAIDGMSLNARRVMGYSVMGSFDIGETTGSKKLVIAGDL